MPRSADGDAELLSDRIRNALTDAIVSGELAPGMSLDEQQLADRYGVSRTPVREALRQLSASGMIQARGRRSAIVTRITVEQIMNGFETMAEIEAICVRLATYRITLRERSKLLQIHDAGAALVAAEDVDGYDDLNRRFHDAIYDATHNDFLAEEARGLRIRLKAFRRTQLRLEHRLSRSHAEHHGIVQAMSEGDGDKAARRMRAHMLNAASALELYIATPHPGVAD